MAIGQAATSGVSHAPSPPAKMMVDGMQRAVYCRQQAGLCRELATQLSLLADVQRLTERARAYDAEADRIDTAPDEPHIAIGKPISEV